jgi:hypothetical protein
MPSGGSANPSVVRPAGRPARRSAPRRGSIPDTAAVEVTPPVDTAAVGHTPRVVMGAVAVAATPPVAVAAATPAARARCTRRSAPSAAATRKSRSNRGRTNPSTVVSASSCAGRQCPRATTTTTRSGTRTETRAPFEGRPGGRPSWHAVERSSSTPLAPGQPATRFLTTRIIMAIGALPRSARV